MGVKTKGKTYWSIKDPHSVNCILRTKKASKKLLLSEAATSSVLQKKVFLRLGNYGVMLYGTGTNPINTFFRIYCKKQLSWGVQKQPCADVLLVFNFFKTRLWHKSNWALEVTLWFSLFGVSLLFQKNWRNHSIPLMMKHQNKRSTILLNMSENHLLMF